VKGNKFGSVAIACIGKSTRPTIGRAIITLNRLLLATAVRTRPPSNRNAYTNSPHKSAHWIFSTGISSASETSPSTK
jgi:hypothetical protein